VPKGVIPALLFIASTTVDNVKLYTVKKGDKG
jgi:hypothetical protein